MAIEAAPLSMDDADDDRRFDKRHNMIGKEVKLLLDATQFTIHLKDLSCTGLCGLTDAPLAPGQLVFLKFDQCESVVAEIRWIRKALIGAAFMEPLSLDQVQRFKRKAKNISSGAAGSRARPARH